MLQNNGITHHEFLVGGYRLIEIIHKYLDRKVDDFSSVIPVMSPFLGVDLATFIWGTLDSCNDQQ